MHIFQILLRYLDIDLTDHITFIKPFGTGSIFSLINRVRRTVRGSADDIGWLERDSEMPPAEDGTERFTEILENIRYNFCISNYICLHLCSMVTFHLLSCFSI